MATIINGGPSARLVASSRKIMPATATIMSSVLGLFGRSDSRVPMIDLISSESKKNR